MAEFLNWLSLAGNAVFAIPIILAVWGICIFFDCFADDEENQPEDQDYDRLNNK